MQPSLVAEVRTQFEKKPAVHSRPYMKLMKRYLSNSALANPDPYCVLSELSRELHNPHKVFEIWLQVSVAHFPSSTSAKFWLLLKLFLNLYLQQ